jgi:hypothetical protein
VVTTTAATTAAAADSWAAAAMTGEPAPPDGCAMRARIMLGHHFDVQVILASVDLAIFDPAIRKMHLSIEERQVVIVRPLRDLALVAIGPAIGRQVGRDPSRGATAGARASARSPAAPCRFPVHAPRAVLRRVHRRGRSARGVQAHVRV